MSDSMDSNSRDCQQTVQVLVDAAHAALSPGTYMAKVIGDSVGRGVEHAIAVNLASALRPLLLLACVLAAVVVAWRLSWARAAATRRGRPVSVDEGEGRALEALDALDALGARATALEAENRELRLAAACRIEYMGQIQKQLLLQPPPEHLGPPPEPEPEPERPGAPAPAAAVEGDARRPDAGELGQLAREARARRGGLVRKTAVLAFLTARGLPHALYERVRVDAALRDLEGRRRKVHRCDVMSDGRQALRWPDWPTHHHNHFVF